MVDSLFCGKATAVATCHWHVAKSRLSNPPEQKNIERTQMCLLDIWWGMVDSNHRRRCQQIYSLSPLATREIPHIQFVGAGRRIRTPDLLITNQLLYQLSYTSASTNSKDYISKGRPICQHFYSDFFEIFLWFDFSALFFYNQPIL